MNKTALEMALYTGISWKHDIIGYLLNHTDYPLHTVIYIGTDYLLPAVVSDYSLPIDQNVCFWFLSFLNKICWREKTSKMREQFVVFVFKKPLNSQIFSCATKPIGLCWRQRYLTEIGGRQDG